ncbi:hypothetical protein AWL63_04180 [Sphingomonas panacis]|uniref:HTH tetR-type domain-containing protein n=1 Tax=Sphingomonas panacis TaxID=1560345 RepID=A0A1B3Z790_9SPHN|nr:TetR family transcriptional regulator [Sphingomonas panacis]AOH83287.1 hypothetical protein AWL63_04180 [Sphingomonas panacis]
MDVGAREQLLNAAADLMRERGSIDITLTEIARRANINSAMVKYYFGNKAGMLVELLRKVMLPGMKQLDHLLGMSISPEKKLEVHISGIANTYLRHPYINALMHHLILESPETFGAVIDRELSRPVAEAQRQIMAEGVKAGVFREMDPVILYLIITGTCDQLFLRKLLLRELLGGESLSEERRRQFVEELCSIILDGIRVR